LKKTISQKKEFREIEIFGEFMTQGPKTTQWWRKINTRAALLISGPGGSQRDTRHFTFKVSDDVMLVKETRAYTIQNVEDRVIQHVADARQSFEEARKKFIDELSINGYYKQAASTFGWYTSDVVISEEKLRWSLMLENHVMRGWTPEAIRDNFRHIREKLEEEARRWYPNYSTNMISNCCEGFQQKARVMMIDSFGGFSWLSNLIDSVVEDQKFEDAIEANDQWRTRRALTYIVDTEDLDWLSSFGAIDASTRAVVNTELAKRIPEPSETTMVSINAAEMERSLMEPFISEAARELGEGMEELSQIEQEDFNSKK
jgi:hypothetical protein